MGTPVGLRASKEEFMHAIDLDARNHDHDRWYQAMRDEAINVYRALTRSDLIESMRNDINIQPPFYWHHVHQDRLRWAIAEIWRRAGLETRSFFAKGRSPNGDEGTNWVIGWLLYSVFRSRDERNRRRKPDDKGPSNPNGPHGSSGGGSVLGGSAKHGGTLYDAVNDRTTYRTL